MSELALSKITNTNSGVSVDTEYVTQGVAKVWVQYDHTGASISGSFNVSSVNDIATGRIQVAIGNNMADTNWAGSCLSEGYSHRLNNSTSLTAASFWFDTHNSSDTLTDYVQSCCIGHGDLA